MKTHHDLTVWKKSIDFVTTVYKITEEYPKTEIYGLTNQVRRAVVSVPSNIAEGAARTSKKEFSHFLSISLGSISEVETQLIVSRNLNYITNEQLENLLSELIEIRKMIIGLKKTMSDY
ncbi:MAG TPA: four helix bundle protein [Paludibacteraceae bacterium]|nr:four helix bundle protein [Paludibacteraceae bacterium]